MSKLSKPPPKIWLPRGDWKEFGQSDAPWIRASWASNAWGDSGIEYVRVDTIAALEQRLAEAEERVAKVEGERNQLWALLDDIDTLDDAAKSDDLHFRNVAKGLQRRRFSICPGDEWDRVELAQSQGESKGRGDE